MSFGISHAQRQRHSSLNYPPIQLGGKAAKKVYRTLDVFNRILELASDRTLTRVMRVEKSAVSVVARVLYRKVHKSELSNLIRPSPRLDIYTGSVRTLDQSPRRRPRVRRHIGEPAPTRIPHRMVPATIISEVARLRGQFPNLKTVLRRYPTYYEDDDYVIHLQGENILVELQSYVMLDEFFAPPTSKVGSRKFPKTPPSTGRLRVRHTIAIKTLRVEGPPHGAPRQDYQHLVQLWLDWLFSNPELDPRVTSIDVRDISGCCSAAVQMAFLRQRKQSNCEPMTNVFLDIPPGNSGPPIDILSLLNPAIRTLHIHEDFLNHLDGDAGTALALLDQALPSLHYLTISYGYKNPGAYPTFKRPISGFPALRELDMEGYRWREGAAEVVRLFGGIGVKGCQMKVRDLPGFQDLWDKREW